MPEPGIFSISSSQPQNFSLPSDVIRYVLGNPTSSSHGILKLYQTCKYFFAKQPIHFLSQYEYDWDRPYFFIGWDYQTEDKKVLFWFTNFLQVSYISTFPSHQIYRCTITIFASSSSTLSLSDFELIVKENTIKDFRFYDSYIEYPDGSDVPVNVILEKLPNVSDFYHREDEQPISMETLTNLKRVKLWNKLDKFFITLNILTDDFDPIHLCEFIKLNAKTDSSSIFNFTIAGLDSHNNCMALHAAVGELIGTWNGVKPSIEIQHKSYNPY